MSRFNKKFSLKMKDIQPILEPKKSTIQKILLYSKSINSIKTNIISDHVIVHLN